MLQCKNLSVEKFVLILLLAIDSSKAQKDTLSIPTLKNPVCQKNEGLRILPETDSAFSNLKITLPKRCQTVKLKENTDWTKNFDIPKGCKENGMFEFYLGPKTEKLNEFKTLRYKCELSATGVIKSNITLGTDLDVQDKPTVTPKTITPDVGQPTLSIVGKNNYNTLTSVTYGDTVVLLIQLAKGKGELVIPTKCSAEPVENSKPGSSVDLFKVNKDTGVCSVPESHVIGKFIVKQFANDSSMAFAEMRVFKFHDKESAKIRIKCDVYVCNDKNGKEYCDRRKMDTLPKSCISKVVLLSSQGPTTRRKRDTSATGRITSVATEIDVNSNVLGASAWRPSNYPVVVILFSVFSGALTSLSI